MYRIIILPKAKEDILIASSWYNQKVYGLGNKFILAVISRIDRLKEDIIVYKPVYINLCRVFAKRFPFIIYFRKDELKKEIVIYAILHNKQNRSVLEERI